MQLSATGFILTFALGLLVGPLAAQPQPTGKVAHLGILTAGNPFSSEVERERSPFRQTLRKLGWVEGKNLVIEERHARGNYKQLPDLAAELVRLSVDALVTPSSTVAVLTAKHATSTIPIVFYGISDPVELGLVTSLAQPGGNITGVSIQSREITPKRLQLLKEAMPEISRVAVLWNPDHPVHPVALSAAKEAAGALGLQLDALAVRAIAEIEPACHTIRSDQVIGLFVLGDVMFNTQRNQIVQCAIEKRLASMYNDRQWVEGGGLMSYGADSTDTRQRAAALVDKILRGAKPADLPVEQPMKFELVINLKTAQALGLTIPPILLYQATEVIR